MKLFFGENQLQPEGYTRVGATEQSQVEVVHDLDTVPWPWEGDSVHRIIATGVVERLKINLVEFCNEAWRVLQPGGELFVRTPHHDGVVSWIDPLHRWHLHERSFEYFDPDVAPSKSIGHGTLLKWRILSLGVREGNYIHALLTPRK